MSVFVTAISFCKNKKQKQTNKQKKHWLKIVLIISFTLLLTDRIFCHFGPFFAFLPPNDPENQNFVKPEKMPGDTIILRMYTISDNHLMYGS